MRHLGCFLLDKFAVTQAFQQREVGIVFQTVAQRFKTQRRHRSGNTSLGTWVQKVALPVVPIAKSRICPNVALRVAPVHRGPVKKPFNFIAPVQPKREAIVEQWKVDLPKHAWVAADSSKVGMIGRSLLTKCRISPEDFSAFAGPSRALAVEEGEQRAPDIHCPMQISPSRVLGIWLFRA